MRYFKIFETSEPNHKYILAGYDDASSEDMIYTQMDILVHTFESAGHGSFDYQEIDEEVFLSLQDETVDVSSDFVQALNDETFNRNFEEMQGN